MNLDHLFLCVRLMMSECDDGRWSYLPKSSMNDVCDDEMMRGKGKDLHFLRKRLRFKTATPLVNRRAAFNRFHNVNAMIYMRNEEMMY